MTVTPSRIPCAPGKHEFVCEGDAEGNKIGLAWCVRCGVSEDVPSTEFEFTVDEDGKVPIETAVFEALGAASTCWSETPRGVFDSERAEMIGDKLIALLAELLRGEASAEATTARGFPGA